MLVIFMEQRAPCIIPSRGEAACGPDVYILHSRTKEHKHVIPVLIRPHGRLSSLAWPQTSREKRPQDNTQDSTTAIQDPNPTNQRSKNTRAKCTANFGHFKTNEGTRERKNDLAPVPVLGGQCPP